MKVALFVHCFYPAHYYGTEAYTLSLARNLIALGHDVTVVSAVFPGEPRQSSLVERYEYEGIPVISLDKNELPDQRVKDTYYQPLMREVLGAVLDELRPDLVHVTHLVNHTAVLLEVVSRRGIPACATFTDFFGFCYNNRLERYDAALCAGPSAHALNCLGCHLSAAAPGGALVRALVRPAMLPITTRAMYAVQSLPPWRTGRLAGLVQDIAQRPTLLRALYQAYRHAIAPTAFLYHAYEANDIGVPMTRIPFGIDLPRHPKAKRGGGKLTLGFIGQIMRHKGPDLLIEAARRALDPARFELRIYGSETQDTVYSASLRAQAAGLPVRFLGTFPPDRIREVLDELDVLVIPSRWYENGPLVLLNALASHTPVVVADVEGMTEFVTEGSSGYAFRRGDARSLGDVLARIAADPEHLERMVSETHYDVTTLEMTRRTLGVYESVLGAPAGGARPLVLTGSSG